MTVDTSLIAMAREGSDLLKPFGKNLRDAVIFYLGHLNRLSSSALATQVRSEFKRRMQANEVSDRHGESLNETLKKLEARFGSQLVSEIRTEEVRNWLEVKFEEKRIIVPRYKGKNRKRYSVALSENALAWLKPYVRDSGSLLVPSRSINRFSKEMGRPSVTATRRLRKQQKRDSDL